MTAKTVCIFLLAVGTVLAAGLPRASAQSAITIFFTGNELGALKPCGCSGGQLGGLDRRYAVFTKVQPENQLVIDTGSIVSGAGEQDLIKFNIAAQAFNQLGYDVVNLTAQDIDVARQAGLLDGLGALFSCITAAHSDGVVLPAKFTKKFVINGSTVSVTVAVIRTQEQIERLGELLAVSDVCGVVPVNILIAGQADADIIALARRNSRLVDCIIVPPQSDEPMLVGDANDRPLVVSVGRLGKYVGKIQLVLSAPSDKARLSFTSIAITEDLPSNQGLVELYKDYQRMVRDANLMGKYPRFVLPDNLQYVGSKFCKLCHDYEYEKWETSQPVVLKGKTAPAQGRHADAFSTLERVGSDYDPECVICHVIGMQYQSGFISPVKTPELKDVGCENCHGPGSEHIRSLGAVETAGPMSTCTDCHTAEHGAEYAGNKELYFEKIVHWKEPVSFTKVKEH